ncbi:hypothetical protein HAX54_017026 [Datura stramonium]|uniref:Uncharacterized protein n=1 Tax=Datura stramonium TaxID=4076 RepID=A0ABS8S0E0_DATST|nr:hypothetical protein [Datura stramonium]
MQNQEENDPVPANEQKRAEEVRIRYLTKILSSEGSQEIWHPTKDKRVLTREKNTKPICNMEIKEMQSNREQKTAETEGGREKDTEYHVDSQEEVAGIADPLSQMIMMLLG